MKLSTKSRYGVRILIDIAMNEMDEPVRLAGVAERQEVSARYLEQVAADLRKAGYLRSVKGAQGGYRLAMPPKNIIIGNILRLFEGDIQLTDDPQANGTPIDRTLQKSLYDKLNREAAAYLDSLTLQDLLEQQQRLYEGSMYYI